MEQNQNYCSQNGHGEAVGWQILYPCSATWAVKAQNNCVIHCFHHCLCGVILHVYFAWCSAQYSTTSPVLRLMQYWCSKNAFLTASTTVQAELDCIRTATYSVQHVAMLLLYCSNWRFKSVKQHSWTTIYAVHLWLNYVSHCINRSFATV